MRLLALLLLCSTAAAAQLNWQLLGDESVNNLRAYLRIDTQNPPANVGEAAKFLKSLLEKDGFEVRLYESAPGKVNLLTRLAGSGASSSKVRPILLLNHMDVVPVDASRWKVPPFGGIVEGGRIWGRGAMDMKGLGMIELMALIALKRAGHRPDRDIIFLATADEETGGTLGADWMIANHWRELNPEYVIDEGGFGTRDMFAATRSGTLPVTGKLVWGISVADKRPYWIRVAASGTSGHGSQPIADNANIVLMHALQRILDRPQPASEIPLVRTMREKVGTLADNKFTNAIQRNTISLTVLRSGVGDPPKANVIPSRAEAILDCRLLPGESPEKFLAALKATAAEPKLTYEVIELFEPNILSSDETPLWRVMERVLLRHTPGAIVTPIMVPYGTDGNAFRQKGSIVYGFTPMVVDLAVVSSMHSDQEQIPLEEFQRGVRILYDMLAELTCRRRN